VNIGRCIYLDNVQGVGVGSIMEAKVNGKGSCYNFNAFVAFLASK